MVGHVSSSIFRALDDETRRLILDELAARDGQTLFEICSSMTMKHQRSMTRQAVSHHLAVLEEAGLVHSEKRGRSKFHYFTPAPLRELATRWPLAERNPS